MTQMIYCVKCRRKTPATNLHTVTTANGRHMLQGICTVSRTKVCKFIPSSSTNRKREINYESKYDDVPPALEYVPGISGPAPMDIDSQHSLRKKRKNSGAHHGHKKLNNAKRKNEHTFMQPKHRQKKRKVEGSGIFGNLIGNLAGNALTSLIPI